ncbi:TetR/AcrR family transcriptional regulator [Streptomyces sp. NPDC005811]|uniref:TetR/AcrR family transcriptional regulator n=1 Tax=Streptomyces sp. NPDC005811 TaxID=3154565 RepID=UPI0033DB6E8C
MSTSRIDGRTLRFQHRRPELLAAATEYVLEHGATDLSLRPVAQALGVSHATLLRHFSSKDELITGVLESIRTDLATSMASDMELLEARSTAALVRAVWKKLCEPQQQRRFLLLFEANRDRDLAQSIVEDWISVLSDSLAREGWPPEDASALATLLLAQLRGLQLDLFVSRDQARADRAIDFAVRLVERTTGSPTADTRD